MITKKNKAEEKRVADDARLRDQRMQRYDAHMNPHGHFSMRRKSLPAPPNDDESIPI